MGNSLSMLRVLRFVEEIYVYCIYIYIYLFIYLFIIYCTRAYKYIFSVYNVFSVVDSSCLDDPIGKHKKNNNMVCWNIDHFFFDDFRSYFETSMFSSSIKEKNTSCLVRASQNTWICRRYPPKINISQIPSSSNV